MCRSIAVVGLAFNHSTEKTAASLQCFCCEVSRIAAILFIEHYLAAWHYIINNSGGY